MFVISKVGNGDDMISLHEDFNAVLVIGLCLRRPPEANGGRKFWSKQHPLLEAGCPAAILTPCSFLKLEVSWVHKQDL